MADKTIPVYCPACDLRQIDSLMIKDTSTAVEGMVVRCLAQNHRFVYEKLMALNPRKVKLQLHEKQPGNTTTIAVWVYPEVLAALQKRYPDNLQTTLCSFMTAIADPDSIVVEGEHARALKASGVAKGRDIMGLAEIVKQLESEVETARIQMKALGPMMQMFQQAQMYAAPGQGGFQQGPPIQAGHPVLNTHEVYTHNQSEPEDPMEAAMYGFDQQPTTERALQTTTEPKF